MKFKEPVQLKPGTGAIDYLAYDSDYDPKDNPVFQNTEIERDEETGIDYLVGDYFGSENLTPYSPAKHFRTRVTKGELITLLEASAYSKIYRAAYPPGNQEPDDVALFFFARGNDPTSEDGLIDVNDKTMVDALAYFESKNYITVTDIARVQKGLLIE